MFKSVYVRKFVYWSRRMLMAEKFYRQVQEKYGKDTKILLSPHFSTGDAYIIGSYLKEYVKQNNCEHNYVYVCVGKTCAKIVNGMYGVYNIILTSMDDRNMLEELYRFVGEENCNIRIMHYQGVCMYTGIMGNMRAYKNLNFIDMLLYGAFNLPKDTIREKAKWMNNYQYVQELFDGLNLKEGKTVIISPYASSMVGLPNELWDILVTNLINQGYQVCTNVGNPQEQPLKNTKALFYPLSCANEVLEKAGSFIGYRSGFCDIVSGALCKKIVLYPENINFGVGSTFDYFGIREMGLTNDIVEIEYDSQYQEQIITQILNIIIEQK